MRVWNKVELRAINWEIVPLTIVSQIDRGTEPGSASYCSPNDGIRFLRVGDITGKGDSPIFTKSKNIFVVTEDDILLVLDGSPGIVGKDFSGAISSGIRRVTPKDNNILDKEWLYFVLQSPQVQSVIRANTRGITIAHASGAIDQIEIPLPPLPEQQRIVAILRQADMLRKWRGDANHVVEQLAPSIFHKLFGAEENKWEIKKLVDLCDDPDDIKCGPFGTQLKRNEYQDHGVPLWSIPHVNQHFTIPTKEFLSQQKAEELDSYSLLPGDLVMTRKATVGNCTIYPDDFEKGIMHSDLLRIRVDRNKCIPEYLFGELSFSQNVSNQIEALSAGAVTKGVNVGKLKQISVNSPPMYLQIEFAKRLMQIRDVEESILDNERKIKILFESISSRAFTGELTKSWREKHKEELQHDAAERDKKLGLRGEVAKMREAVEGRLTPEEEKRFREMTARIAEKMASLQPNTPNIAETLVTIHDFSEIAKLITSRMINQDAVILNMQKTLSEFSMGMKIALAQMSPVFKTTGSLTDALMRSAEAFRDAFAGSLVNIATEIARREKELADVELTEKQQAIFNLLQQEEGYFSAKSISQKYSLRQQDVIDVLALFDALGLVLKVDIPDEANSTPTFPVFEPAYRNSRSSDDSRSDDLDALERNINESAA